MRARKAFYNVIISGVYEIVVLIYGLVLPRFFLNAFGSSDYGLISSIGQFVSYISLLTIGVGGPTRVALYKTLSTNDMYGTCRVLRATRDFYWKICRLFVFYVIVLSVVYPYIVDSRLERYQVSILIIIISAGTLSEYIFGMTYSLLLIADQSSYIYICMRTVSKILSAVCIIFLINEGYSLIFVELGIASISILPPASLNIYVKKKYKIDLSVNPDSSALSQRKDAMASSIANIVHDRTDVFLLTMFTTTAYISVYSIYMMVMSGLTNVMKIFTNNLEAPFGNMYAKGEIREIKVYLRLYEFFIFSFVVIVFGTASVMILPFVSLYTKGIHDIEYILPLFAWLLIIATSMQCLRQPYLTIVQAAGKYKENKVGNYIEAALNICISVMLVKRYGLVGITFGTLVANTFRTILYVKYISQHIICRKMIEFYYRFIWLITCFICIHVVSSILDITIKYETWRQWFTTATIVTVCSTLITIIMGMLFYKNDLMGAIRIVRRMIIRENK